MANCFAVCQVSVQKFACECISDVSKSMTREELMTVVVD